MARRWMGTVAVLAVAVAGWGAPAQQSPQQAPQQAPAPPANTSNPFPEDTSTVPVVPAHPEAGQPVVPPEETSATAALMLAAEDRDPARSPDDAAPDEAGPAEESSSSLRGMEKVLPAAGEDDEKKGRHHRKPEADNEPKPKSKKTAASEDVEVAKYYLERGNWRAAMSRFESAMVLDPENPDVYFGLAVAEHRLGRYASARAHYQMVAEYDPDSKEGKEARRALKDPVVAKGVDPKPEEKPADAQNEPQP